MKPDNSNSGSSSAATSETKPPAPDAPPETLTEAEFLAQQAEAAKQAMSAAWGQIKARLGQGAAPAAWAKEYPWITVGAAAVAGFIATAAIVPSKEQQALKKLASIERALNPHPPKAEPASDHSDGKQESPSIWATILREVLALARPILTGLVSANLGGMPRDPQAAEHPEQAPEGHA